jgi:hypothetical protein
MGWKNKFLGFVSKSEKRQPSRQTSVPTVEPPPSVQWKLVNLSDGEGKHCQFYHRSASSDKAINQWSYASNS